MAAAKDMNLHATEKDLRWMGDSIAGRTYYAFKAGPLSQWHRTRFTDDALPGKYGLHTFTSCEQYMMVRKALLFRDSKTADAILTQINCDVIKKLGRSVRNFDEHLWDNQKLDIVIRGNYLKFSQNETLKKLILKTEPAFLVEGSMSDRIWGVGLSCADPRIHNPSQWRGSNLLGKCLTYVRGVIGAECTGSLVSPLYDSTDADDAIGDMSESDESSGEEVMSEEAIKSMERLKARMMEVP
jgi:ribA/ribD-fused uncharacterized protein